MTDPIQEQLIAARKNQILDAAQVVFAEKGFHPATIHDIARQAGIADGTIYNYFANKPALLLGIFARLREALVPAGSPPVPAGVDLRTFLTTFLAQPLTALQDDEFALFRIVVAEMMVNEELRRLYYQEILEPTLALAETAWADLAAQQGLTADAAESRLVMRALAGLVMGLILTYLMGDEVTRAHWAELPALLADLVLDGLVPAG